MQMIVEHHQRLFSRSTLIIATDPCHPYIMYFLHLAITQLPLGLNTTMLVA